MMGDEKANRFGSRPSHMTALSVASLPKIAARALCVNRRSTSSAVVTMAVAGLLKFTFSALKGVVSGQGFSGFPNVNPGPFRATVV